MKAIPDSLRIAAAAGLAILSAQPGTGAPLPQPPFSPGSFRTPGELTEALRREVDRHAEAQRLKQPPAAAVREAPTHANLEQAYKEGLRNNPMRGLTQDPDRSKDPAKVAPPSDLIASSDILCHRGKATLVPKRAILVSPANFSSRMKMDKGALILNWAEFFAVNRDWIRTVEVTRPQAEGVAPLPEATAEMLKSAKTLVVATYQGGPISVLPLKVVAETETPTPDKP